MLTDNEFYYWSTEEAHADNNETMYDFLDNHLPDDYRVILVDGTYAEVEDKNGFNWAVHASGDGDFTHHMVQFEKIGFCQFKTRE